MADARVSMRFGGAILTLAAFTTVCPAAPRADDDARPRAAAVTVVASLGVEAHREAVEGIRGAIGGSVEIRIVDLAQAGSTDRVDRPGTRLIIALGTGALDRITAEGAKIPVISAMVLRHVPSNLPEQLSPAATIALDVPVQVLLARLKQLFPGKTRLGLIRNSSQGGPAAAAIAARAEQAGFTVQVIDCPGPEALIPALLRLKGAVDFVWCLPDGTLYNSATIKPLILASIDQRLPLIGFSESFARAGAAIGVYPDFRDVGRQTGEVALQILNGQAVRPVEGPRKLKIAVNQSVLRLLGLRYSPEGARGGDFSILQ